MKVARVLLSAVAAVVRSASLIVTVGGTVSTVKDRDTTSLSFPAASTALTKKLWGPSERPRCGGIGALRPSRPRSHRLRSGIGRSYRDSVEENPKLGVGSLVTEPSAGPDEIVTTGRVVSMVKSREAVSVPCWTANVWSPSESAGLVNGEVQSASTTTPSIWQLKPPASGEEKAKLGVGSLVGEPEAGPEVIARPIFQIRSPSRCSRPGRWP